jgi:ssDNA-binding Zn-finger/Zn-ribbon topoisomerase 1
MDKTIVNIGAFAFVLGIIFLALGMSASGYDYFQVMLLLCGIIAAGGGLLMIFGGLGTESQQEHPKQAMEHPTIVPCKFCGKQFKIPSSEFGNHLQTEHPKELEVDRLFTLAGAMLVDKANRGVSAAMTTVFNPNLGGHESTRLAVEETRMWQNIEGLLQQAYTIHPEYTKKVMEKTITKCQSLNYLEGVVQYTRILGSMQQKGREEQVIIKIRCPYCHNIYDETMDKCPHCGGKR